MCELEPLNDEDRAYLRSMVEKHVSFTQSPKAKRLLADWEKTLTRFTKVIPVEYRKVLQQLAEKKKLGTAVAGVTVG